MPVSSTACDQPEIPYVKCRVPDAAWMNGSSESSEKQKKSGPGGWAALITSYRSPTPYQFGANQTER
jgi:hypothetical protein